jgi:urease alpha subunit
LEVGKMADLVLWDGDPFSVYTRAEQVFIDGAPVFDRSAPTVGPSSDFELGLIAAGERP